VLVVVAVVVAAGAAAIAWLAVIDLPYRLSDVPGLTEAERATSRDAIRGSLVQAVGGGLVALGLVFTARTFSVTRQSHITERYTAAIGQLGGSSVHVRLGGLFALERIAHDSKRDEPTITEVLCAFVRSKGSTQVGAATQEEAQAALRVIGRLPGARIVRALDLRAAELNGMTLSGARLAGADLSDAKLIRAQLEQTDLREAILARADLTRATLDGADLSGAHVLPKVILTNASCIAADLRCEMDGAVLIAATLRGADLRLASLRGADLSHAVLKGEDPRRLRAEGADFHMANLQAANVRGVDLSGARGLTTQQRDGALGDEATRWPMDVG
jgi:uncharacterized protein YjbI with pentapeptide repeats